MRRSFAAAWMLLPGLLLLSLGFLLPMGQLLWSSLHRAGMWTLVAYAEILGSRVFFGVLLHTISTAVVVTLLCVALGYPFAYFVATRARRHGAILMSLVAVPYLTSILIRSYAWVALLSREGLVNRALLAVSLIQHPLQLVFNRFGSYVGMVHILLPMAVFPIYGAMQRIEPALLRAASGLGAPPANVFFEIFLPLSWPGISAGAALVGLSTLGFYVTPALLGGAGDYMLAQAIEVRVDTLAEFDAAAAQAIFLFVLVTFLMVLFRHRIVAATMDRPTDQEQNGVLFQSPFPRLFRHVTDALAAIITPSIRLLLWVYTALLLIFLLMPMIVVVLISFTSAPYLSFPPPGYSWRWFRAFFSDPLWLEAIVFSVAVSAVAALTAVAAGTFYAYALNRGRFAARDWLWLFAVSPMILPHITLALGLFFTMVALRLNGSPISFWLGYSVIGLPPALIILSTALGRFDRTLEQAAASLGAKHSMVFRRVTLPLLVVSFASAFLFAFLAGFDDLIISLFLSTPRTTTIAMRIWEDIRLEISPKAAVLGALQLFLLLSVLFLVWLWRIAGRGTTALGRVVLAVKAEQDHIAR